MADLAERAARLAKADLVTGMVGEFPELQGVIGGHLARAQGEPDAIADAIRDHYKPVGQGDDVPIAPVTVAVSLADKVDTIVSFFSIGEKPTGSKDPFAVRRAALSVIALLRENSIRAPLNRLVRVSMDDLLDRHGPTHPRTKAFGHSQTQADVFATELVRFLIDRLTVQAKNEGTRHDLVMASFEAGLDSDVVRLLACVTALQSFVETSEGANLFAGYKRAANILKKETWDAGATSNADVLPDEAALGAALDSAEPTATTAIAAEDFTAAMSALASLRAPIDAFFDKVIVNDPDAGVRARRLSLLARFRDAVHAVADFSKIEG